MAVFPHSSFKRCNSSPFLLNGFRIREEIASQVAQGFDVELCIDRKKSEIDEEVCSLLKSNISHDFNCCTSCCCDCHSDLSFNYLFQDLVVQSLNFRAIITQRYEGKCDTAIFFSILSYQFNYFIAAAEP